MRLAGGDIPVDIMRRHGQHPHFSGGYVRVGINRVDTSQRDAGEDDVRDRVGPIGQAENYTYSAVWLAFGVVLLIVGILLRSQPVRLASAAVVLLTVGKVFVLDLAGLTGVWRAFSFIGLGLVLIWIALLYQRLLFAQGA